MNKTLAKNIRTNRKNKNMTQLCLAERLFVSPQTVSKWESGASEPDSERLCLMADIFGISLDSLLRDGRGEGESAFIAIDGGGTKTDFLLFNESGEVLDSVTLGGTNPNACTLEGAKATLSRGIDRLVRSGARVEGLFAGISGASAGNNRDSLTAYLAERYPYFKSVVEGDIHNVINSVEGTDRCVAVICGTGSVVYGYDGHTLRRFGGWGYLFDSAGSGFDIGRELFRHALSLEDMGESDEICAAIRSRLGGGIFENISAVYGGGRDLIASFAPIAFELYDKGNAVATRIVEDCAARLGELICAARREVDCGRAVVVAGGLSERRDILEPLIRKHIGEDSTIVFPTARPIFGAAVKCLRLFSHAGSEEIEKILKNGEGYEQNRKEKSENY